MRGMRQNTPEHHIMRQNSNQTNLHNSKSLTKFQNGRTTLKRLKNFNLHNINTSKRLTNLIIHQQAKHIFNVWPTRIPRISVFYSVVVRSALHPLVVPEQKLHRS